MIDEPSEPDVICSCCGVIVEDTPGENAWHGLKPYPGDTGTGLCRRCGGDLEAKDPQGRLGFIASAFVAARIPILAEALSPRNRERFLSMPFEVQAEIIFRFVGAGLLI
jgi:hypothetical protein